MKTGVKTIITWHFGMIMKVDEIIWQAVAKHLCSILDLSISTFEMVPLNAPNILNKNILTIYDQGNLCFLDYCFGNCQHKDWGNCL